MYKLHGDFKISKYWLLKYTHNIDMLLVTETDLLRSALVVNRPKAARQHNLLAQSLTHELTVTEVGIQNIFYIV